ncbi:MAG TPA: low temperature requirement protein A [Streptosporangiaceae bacterium]
MRYAIGVTVVQLLWISEFFLHGAAGLTAFLVLVAAELAVPAWAEFAGQATRWNAGHITERYGEFTIIVLGEVVAATAAAVQTSLGHIGASPGLLTVATAGLLLVFALWWSYFKHSAAEQIRQSLRWTFVWAFGHYLIFAAVAALGAGLQVAIGTLEHSTRVSPAFAAFTIAIPVVIFIVVLVLLNIRGSEPAAPGLTVLTAALVLAAAAATPILTLPVSIVIMVLLVVLLLAYHLAAAHQAIPRAQRRA